MNESRTMWLIKELRMAEDELAIWSPGSDRYEFAEACIQDIKRLLSETGEQKSRHTNVATL